MVAETLKSVFAANLKNLLNENHWTQQDLCNRLNANPYNHHVKRNSVSDWVTGKVLPNKDLIPDIADIFHVTEMELFTPQSPKISLSLKQTSVSPGVSLTDHQKDTLNLVQDYIIQATDEQCKTLQGIIRALPRNEKPSGE